VVIAGCALLAALFGCGHTPPARTPAAAPRAHVPPPPPPADLAAIPDAVPRVEPRARFGNPPFYEVMGQRYVLLPRADGYLERGVASWYGPDFHGVATSTGEPYDMYGMTAAHKTLPLPCYVRVTNLRNGRSVVVRVNDRGPFIGNRIIDLSYTAAFKLDMIREGTALVEVRAVSVAEQTASIAAAGLPTMPESVTPPTQIAAAIAAPVTAAPLPASPATPVPLYVQAGAFTREPNAQRLVERLRAAGLSNAFVGSTTRGDRTWFRVRLGPVATVADFDQLVAKLATLGIPDARLATD
jgi:rare lipoprotein A